MKVKKYKLKISSIVFVLIGVFSNYVLASVAVRATYDLHNSRVEQVKEGVQKAQQQLKKEQEKLVQAKAKTISAMANFVGNVAEKENVGKVFNYKDLGKQEGESLKQIVSYTKQLHLKCNCSWTEAAKAAVIVETTNNGEAQFLNSQEKVVEGLVKQERAKRNKANIK